MSKYKKNKPTNKKNKQKKTVSVETSYQDDKSESFDIPMYDGELSSVTRLILARKNG